MNPVTQYALDVTQNRILSCKWVKLACQRHLRDLKDSRFRFDEGEAQRWIDFFPENLRHYKGDCAGQPFALEPWEEFLVGSIYGWRWGTTGRRRYRYAYIEVPRKNGKTAIIGGIGLGGLLVEPGAEVYSVATKEDQAKLSWRDGVTFAKHSPALSRVLRPRVKVLHYDKGNAIWRPLGSDSDTQDGLNPSVTLVDEFHAMKNRALYDVMDDAQGARAEPLMLIITTAGFNKLGVCYETREHLTEILEDTIQDDSFFGIIYTVDDPAKWEDEDEWRKANPNLGVSKTWEFMRDQAKKAKQMPGKLNAFLNKQLNIWTEAEVAWIPAEKWESCQGDFTEIDLHGSRCFGGLDLSTKVDLSAFGLYFPDTQRVVCRFWMPEETLSRRAQQDRVPYDLWSRQGWIKVTEGNAVDYRVIRDDIREMLKEFRIEQIGFDPWNATETAIKLIEEGATMVEVRQGARTFSEPMKEFEREIVSGELEHDGNPVLAWMMGNVSIKEDENGNIRPVKPDAGGRKPDAKKKIDGPVALLMAKSRAITDTPPAPPKEFSIRVL